MTPDLVAGIDSSTQSCTIVVRSMRDGSVAGMARALHSPTTPPKSEQWPEDWWEAMLEAMAGLGPLAHRIGAVSVGSQGHGLVLLDEYGHALAKAKLWNDTESAPDAETLAERLPAADWVSRTGSAPGPAMTISKIAWMERHYPDLLRRARQIMLPANYLSWRLSGRSFTDRGLATGSGVFNPFLDVWDHDLACLAAPHLDWSAILPDIIGSAEAGGEVTATGEPMFPRGCVVGAGSGDNMTAALGMDVREGDVVISLGTSGTIYGITRTPVLDPSGAINGFADATGAFMPMVTTLNAAKVTDAFRRLLNCSPADFDEMALATQMGASDLVLVPYLDGERTPNLPLATGVLRGLRSDVTPGQVARAAIEGVLCGLLEGGDLLARQGLSMDGRLIVTGGAAASRAYVQILADLSGRPVWTSSLGEAAAAGAAVQAMAALSGRSTADIAAEWRPDYRIVAEPDPTTRKRAAAVRERFHAAAARMQAGRNH